MKVFGKLINIIVFLIFATIFFVAGKSIGFSKIFPILGGLFIVGLFFLIFILPTFEKVNSYYDQNKQKKFRFVVIIIFFVLGILSSLAYIVQNTKGLFPTSSNDFGYSVIAFGLIGIIIGFIISRFIKIKQSKYNL